MLGTTKPFASLSSGLLARKGQARPAMRPQGFAGFPTAASLDDLGWNDMGTGAESAPLPPVLVEREALKEEIETPGIAPELAPEMAAAAEAEAVPPAVLRRIGRAARGSKAAFTLRLEADRHLRLRLASAVRHRSAQQIVTEALDAFLNTLPEVEELARQCSRPAGLEDCL